MSDIFESKMKLLKHLVNGHIIRSVSFKPIKQIRHATQQYVVLMMLVMERSALENSCLNPKKFKWILQD